MTQEQIKRVKVGTILYQHDGFFYEVIEEYKTGVLTTYSWNSSITGVQFTEKKFILWEELYRDVTWDVL